MFNCPHTGVALAALIKAARAGCDCSQRPHCGGVHSSWPEVHPVQGTPSGQPALAKPQTLAGLPCCGPSPLLWLTQPLAQVSYHCQDIPDMACRFANPPTPVKESFGAVMDAIGSKMQAMGAKR